MVRMNSQQRRPQTFIRPKQGYQRFTDLIANHELPVTMEISGLQLNGVFTIHQYQTIRMLKCLTQSEEVLYIPEDLDLSVVLTSLDNETSYASIDELRKHRKVDDIVYFVTAKRLRVNDDDYFESGQVFKFAPSTLLRSFCRDRKRGINVLIYPEMKKFFLPLDILGSFIKCRQPFNTTTNILPKKDFPFYLTFPKTEKLNTLKRFYGRNLMAVEFTKHCCYYGSTKNSGYLKVHAFTVNRYTHAKVLAKSYTVDTMDDNEIKMMLDIIPLPRDEKIENFHQIKTYQEIGLVRLLDEIFIELENVFLNNERRFRSLPNSRRRNKIFENDYESLGAIMKMLPLKNNNMTSTLASTHIKDLGYLQSKDGNIHVDRQSCHIYVNDSPLNDAVNSDKRKELIVEFDTGGYVVIPFTGKTPAICFNKGDLYYKSSENDSYDISSTNNTIEPMNDEEEDHVYSYISTDEIQKTKDTEIFASWGLSSIADSCNYDYSYVGQLSLAFNTKTQITHENHQLLQKKTVESISDVLKSLSMNHHVTRFVLSAIDGERLSKMSEVDLLRMTLTSFEARKLFCYIKGWRPLEEARCKDTWLTKSSKDWSVADLCKYLVHVNMRSFLRFASRHQLDGRLLKEILKDDVIDSLRIEHGVMFRANEIDKLRQYVLHDDRPKFKLVR